MCAVIEIDVLKFALAIVWTDMLVSLNTVLDEKNPASVEINPSRSWGHTRRTHRDMDTRTDADTDTRA